MSTQPGRLKPRHVPLSARHLVDSARLWGCIGLCCACSQVDVTRIEVGAALQPAPESAFVADATASTDAGEDGSESPAPSDAALDAAPGALVTPGESGEADQPMPELGPPCNLRVTWQEVQASAEGCVSFSAALESDAAVWDGSTLVFVGGAWVANAGGLERKRVCTRNPTEEWRFHETLSFEGVLPNGRCPTGPVVAQYRYSECPRLETGLPCAEPSACTFEARAVLTSDAQPSAAAAAPPAKEMACRTGKPLGATCSRALDCVDGGFCSRQLPEGGCSGLGAGVCQPAPRLACPTADPNACTCDERPIVQERVCLCEGAMEIPGINACYLRAMGDTTLPCP